MSVCLQKKKFAPQNKFADWRHWWRGWRCSVRKL